MYLYQHPQPGCFRSSFLSTTKSPVDPHKAARRWWKDLGHNCEASGNCTHTHTHTRWYGLWSILQSLTGNIQWSVTTNGLSQVVAGHTGVDALVWFAAAAVHDAEEEERAAGQQHAVRPGVIFVRLHSLAVLIPLDAGRGSALGLAVEGGRLPLGDDQIRGVLRNPRCAVFKPCPGPCGVERRADVN